MKGGLKLFSLEKPLIKLKSSTGKRKGGLIVG